MSLTREELLSWPHEADRHKAWKKCVRNLSAVDLETISRNWSLQSAERVLLCFGDPTVRTQQFHGLKKILKEIE